MTKAQDELTRRVLERAQKEVEQRKEQRQTLRVEAARERLPERVERPWLWGFVGLLATVVAGAFILLPGTFVDRLTWMVYGVCSQEHKLYIGGVAMPLCQRNTGIYAGFLAALLTLIFMGRSRAAKLPPRPVLFTLLAGMAWMAIDGFNSLLLDIGGYNLYPPQEILRILSGLAMGMGVATFLLFAFNSTLRYAPNREQQVVGGWRDLGLLALVAGLLFGVIQLGIGLGTPVILYPLAIFSTVGIILVMFSVNVLVVAMVARYENAVVRISQLARPAMIAIILTVVEFGLLGWARAAVEQTIVRT